MNALNTIYGALRPRGLLLNLHPEAAHSKIEARVGRKTIPLGQLDETQLIHDVTVARRGLQTVIDARRFVIEREVHFTYILHFGNVDEWLAYMAEHAKKAIIPAEVIARARAALPPGTVGELRRPREIYAARLRRV